MKFYNKPVHSLLTLAHRLAILLLVFGHSLLYGQSAPIQVGDTVNGFYHATFIPTVIIKDNVYSAETNGTVFNLDMDGDGSDDLTINSNYYQNFSGGPFGPTYYPVWRCGLTLNNECDMVAKLWHDGTPDTLSFGDPINAASNWSHGTGGEAIFCYNVNNYSFDSTWKNMNQYYVGLRLNKPSGDTLYGWIKLRIQGYHVIYLESLASRSFTPIDTVYTVYAGVEESLMQAEVKHRLFPNPVSVGDKLKSLESLHSATIRIKDSKGVLVKEFNEFSGTEIPLNPAGLSAGVYFVEIIENNINSKHKLIVDGN